jgi:transposase
MNNYKTIIIGKWNTKRIIQNLSFYSFLEKLKYKFLTENVNLNIIDEHYTSKMCTSCGNLKKI